MERIKWIDFGKGFTIFFVVVGHCISNMYVSNQFNNYNNISRTLMIVVFTFIMPCFFALSGFLYKSPENIQNYLSKNLKRLKGLIIPYILFSIIYVFLQQFAKTDVNKLFTWNSLLQIWYRPIAYLWYLYVLFLVIVIVGLMDLLKFNNTIQLVLYCIVFFIVQTSTPLYLVKETSSWILCFFIGVIIKDNIGIMKRKITLVISLFLTLLGLYLQYCLSNGWYDPNELTALTFLSKIASIFLLFYFFNNMKQNHFFDYFERLGSYSMVIYLVHVPIKTFVKVILFKIGISNYLLFLILLILITWELSIFVCYLTRRIKLFDAIFFPNKYF